MKRRLMIAGAGVVLLLAIPPTVEALDLSIFGVIESTISSSIGGMLTSMTSIQKSLQQDQQALLYPVSLINQSRNYITTIMGSYRSWMNGVFTLKLNSAQLTSSQSLEKVFLGGTSFSTGSISSLYSNSYGALPVSAAAPEAHRQMTDMSDALAKDGLAQAAAADQATTQLITIANSIETASSTTAPGTADMLSATARTAELQSLASQHRLLASMLREEAAGLAHQNGIQKQVVQHAQQVNSNLQGTITPQ